MSLKKDFLTKQFKTQFSRQNLRTRKTWLDEKSERSNERENGDVNEWKQDTKETIDSVRMLAEAAEGKDIMTLKIVRKRPFKKSNEEIKSQEFRTQHEVLRTAMYKRYISSIIIIINISCNLRFNT